MKIIKPSVEILSKIDGIEILKLLEKAGRTCYKSENKITNESALDFIKMLIDRGHEAMIEHYNITIKFICDRGVTHEIVRHRLASYAQESTRYCDYTKDKFGSQITYIQPSWFKNNYNQLDSLELQHILNNQTKTMSRLNMPDDEYYWLRAMNDAETHYNNLRNLGWKAQHARSVLPNSLKTEIIMTSNLREWRHFFKLRTVSVAHPQMREVAIQLLGLFKENIPVVFDDIEVE